jgi:predicted amidohydrolase
MNNRYKDRLLLFAAVLLGLGISTGRPIGMMAAAGMPLACLAPGTRKTSFHNAFAYYVGALWPMIPGLEAYWTSELLIPIVLWILSAILLSVPWVIAWTSAHVHCLWRAPLALMATIIPPLGIVGLASPLTGAGYLFPGTSWLGLAVVALVPGVALSTQILQLRHRVVVLFSIIGICTALSVGAVKLHSHDVKLPPGWIAVNTHFGDVTQPFQDFKAAQFIQEKAVEVSARVLIFPESVIPRWSQATEAFWWQSIADCRDRGKILAIGAGIPADTATAEAAVEKLRALESYDFKAALDALRSMRLSLPIGIPKAPPRTDLVDNTLLIMGADTGTFYQRVPVPIAMWRPFRRGSIPLRLGSPGVLTIDHQRAAVLICYEQMLTYPILASMLQNPTLIVGISNTFWVDRSTIPRYQRNALRAWAKLFGLAYLSAINS